MGRRRKPIQEKLRVDQNPNFRQYKDTNYYLSIMGQIYKKGKTKDYPIKTWDHAGSQSFKVNGKRVNATKAFYELFKGKIPEGYIVIHKNGLIKDMNVNNLKLMSRYEFNHINAVKDHRTRYILNLDNGDVYKGITEASKRTGYARTTVYNYSHGLDSSSMIHLKVLDECPYEKVK